MSTTTQKQRCLEIIELWPLEQISDLAKTLEDMYNQMLDEEEDDAFCMKLYEEALASGFDREGAVDIVEFTAGFGIELK